MLRYLSLGVGLEVESGNNDGVGLLIGFIP
jgi:hypothetical protein